VEIAAINERQRIPSIHEDTVVSAYFARKAWPTRILGVLMLLVTCPLTLLLVVLVRLTSAGPGLFRQTRTGRYGKEFMMYKLRTMYDGAESLTGPIWCAPNDSRITPLGRMLRLLHLDELPQLINVARGEMDLIGPRPERPEFVAQLSREIPDYYARLKVLPGITGLAQINLAPDESLNCVRKKLVLDCAYIREANFFLDARIFICTFLRMIGIRHGYAPRWLGLERHVEIRSVLGHDSLYSGQVRTYLESCPAANGHLNGHSHCPAFVTADGKEEDAVADIDSEVPSNMAPPSVRLPR
jgi:lipopolysaccharide/colanic/teichoic acid biosynthesis glycosyltransferase